MSVKNENRERIKEVVRIKKTCTINEALNFMWEIDLKEGFEFMKKRGWKYYVHMNKLFSVLLKNGDLNQVGLCPKTGEKLWSINEDKT